MAAPHIKAQPCHRNRFAADPNASTPCPLSSLLPPDISVVEFGCGRGGLAMAIAAVQPKIKLVLVDRQRVRHKVCVCALLPVAPTCVPHSHDCCPRTCQTDTYIKRLGAEVDRVHCDIKDLCLSQVASLAGRSVVGVAKHLCGNGTDVSLRCMASGLLPTASATQGGFAGMTFATCCHHRCNWRDFCGQEAFVKTMVMTWREPSLLHRLAHS